MKYSIFNIRINLHPIIFFSCLSIILYGPVNVKANSAIDKCTKADKNYAKFWDNYYIPQHAYDFGVKIQNFVKRKDLNALFKLIDGELTSGPRQSYIKNKKFTDIFSENWRQSVLHEKPACKPVGWRGFMLGNGLIWYQKTKQGWHIFAINGAASEPLKTKTPVAWVVSDKLLPPQCFVRLWMSDDNFEEYEKHFSIIYTKNFRTNPGLYFGDKISSLRPIIPSWNSPGDTSTLSLFAYTDQCSSTKAQVDNKQRVVTNKICEKDVGCTQYEYSILAELSLTSCKKLAPHMPGKCLSSYLISIGDYSGGSMGWDFQYNIYGAFKLRDNKNIIIPLKIFYTKNTARNYIDILMK